MLTDIKRYLSEGAFPEDQTWFAAAFLQDNGKFLYSEGENWDFKAEWPFSYSDDYFVHLAKLCIAFANTSGGIIIFGVDDEERQIKRSLVRINVDRFASALSDNVINSPRIQHRRISFGDDELNLLIVYPNSEVTAPSEFNPRAREKHKLARYWIRSAHETIAGDSRHIPILFCGAARLQQGEFKPESALPSNPAHIKQFVGRLEPVKKIFQWLKDPQEQRAFLYGRGGSGKTTIAYEVARVLAEYGGNVEIGGNEYFDQVIFVSSKNKSLNTTMARQEKFVATDFDDAESLLRAILTLGQWTSEIDVSKMDFKSLVQELQLFFDASSCFVVIDDIDTLTTSSIDAGFDQIYRSLIRAKRPSKVLYTQRNAPTQSLMNSIEVPGLSTTGEYQKFVEVCCKQFGVDEPTQEFREGRLAQVTERRPLVLESVLALRRNSGTYERAVMLFEENVGTDARSYVFGREWDALSGDHSRQLLCALALYGRPLSFSDLHTILRYDDARIFDAINDTREMFLERNEVGEETFYSLGDLTRAFVLEKSRDLDRFSAVEARVNSFKRSFFPELPELSRLIQNCDNLIRVSSRFNDASHVAKAWRSLNDESLAAKITEDPRFRAYRGYVGTKMNPVPISSVRDDFDFALSMKYEPPTEHLLSWFGCEEQSGEAS